MNLQIIEVNTQLKEMTNDIPNAVFLDVYHYFTDKNGLLDDNYSADGVHLNSFGYDLLSAKLSAVL